MTCRMPTIPVVIVVDHEVSQSVTLFFPLLGCAGDICRICQDTARRGFPGMTRAQLVAKLENANSANPDPQNESFYNEFWQGNLN